MHVARRQQAACGMSTVLRHGGMVAWRHDSKAMGGRRRLRARARAAWHHHTPRGMAGASIQHDEHGGHGGAAAWRHGDMGKYCGIGELRNDGTAGLCTCTMVAR